MDQKESKEAGSVNLQTWKNYAGAMGGLYVALFLLFLYTASQFAVLISIAEVGRWAEKTESEQRKSGMVAWIAGLTGIVIVLSIVRAFAVFYFAVKASQRMHDDMTNVVLRSKIEFFDTNPIGRRRGIERRCTPAYPLRLCLVLIFGHWRNRYIRLSPSVCVRCNSVPGVVLRENSLHLHHVQPRTEATGGPGTIAHLRHAFRIVEWNLNDPLEWVCWVLQDEIPDGA